MHHPSRSIVAGLVGLLVLGTTACGGSGDSASTAATDTGAASTAIETTAAPATDAPTTAAPTSTAEPAPFSGPAFDATATAALAPYLALIGQPGSATTVGTLLPAVTSDLPIPAGLTLSGAGRSYEQIDADSVEDTQSMAFAEPLDAAALEAFGATAVGGWQQASFATSGSLATLLLTHTDGRRAVYVTESDSASLRAPLELTVEPSAATLTAPSWAASLPALEGGTLVDFTEAAGRVQPNLLGTGEYVEVRWRYAADQLDALNEYLESGVIQSAGFTYDADLFNGFENMVDVTIGDWVGTVIIGEATIDDVTYYDLVWSLGR